MRAKKEKVSSWQSGKIKPALPGLYQRRFSKVDPRVFEPSEDEKYYHYFDGVNWYLFGFDKKDAMLEYNHRSIDRGAKYAEAEWRGVLG